MDSVLTELISIFKPNGIDWMGDKISKKNKFTYHHIIEKKNGGIKNFDNGAILTQNSHTLLNYFEENAPQIYQELNLAFLELNKTKTPPTEKYYKKIKAIIIRGISEIEKDTEKDIEKKDKTQYIRQRITKKYINI